MKTFRMTYPYSRLYHFLGEVQPGQEIKADENPDPNYFEEVVVRGKRDTPAVDSGVEKEENV